jgi:hypothetical protein
MARYVLIAFDDNNAAEEFVAALPVQGGVFFMGSDTHFKNVDPEKTFVRGIWEKPTKMCECPPGPKRTYGRGKRTGWYICSDCGKTHPAWAAGDHLYQSLGVNMLPPSALAPEWRGKGVAHHRFDEGSKNWVHVATGEPFNPRKTFRERKDYHG